MDRETALQKIGELTLINDALMEKLRETLKENADLKSQLKSEGDTAQSTETGAPK